MPAPLSWLTTTTIDHLTRLAEQDSTRDLRTYLAAVPDPRSARGIRHPLPAILLIAAAAVSAGARSFTAIGEWAADAPQHILAAAGARHDPHRNRYQPPDEATVRRVLQRLDPARIQAALHSWITAQTPPTSTPTSGLVSPRLPRRRSHRPRSRWTANPWPAPTPAPAAAACTCSPR